MRIATPLFGDLNKATTSQVDPTESNILVPPQVLVEACVPLRMNTGFVGSGVLSFTSNISSQILQISNAAAGGISIMTLGRGVWLITVESTYASNFDFGNNIAGNVLIVNPAGSVNFSIHSYITDPGVANNIQSKFTQFPLTLAEDGWQFQLLLQAAGAAQTHRIASSIIAAKLL